VIKPDATRSLWIQPGSGEIVWRDGNAMGTVKRMPIMVDRWVWYTIRE
jgi:hypothetical protein